MPSIATWCGSVLSATLLTLALPALAAPAARPLLTTAYFGEVVTHPGLLIGYEQPLWQRDGHRFFLSANAGGYMHPQNHTMAFLMADAGYRLTFPIGLSADVSAGAGYRHAWLPGDVLATTPGGPIRSIADPGRPGLLMITSLGLGYDLPGLPIGADKVFLKLSSFWEYPVNTMTLQHAAIQTGLQWRL